MTPEHGLGDGLEESFARFAGHIIAPPDRGEYRGGSRPCLADIHRRGVADDLPDALSPMLAVDEEAFAARGQHPEAEAPELAVAGVVCGLAGPERPDAGVGEGDSGHSSSPGCSCSRGTEGCGIRSTAPKYGRKNDPISDT